MKGKYLLFFSSKQIFFVIITFLFSNTSRKQHNVVNAFTISTFNILAAVHRSMDTNNTRESERREWWQPRAENLAKFVAQELGSSDIVVLQEWWFREEFEEIFDHYTGHIFERVSERRPGGQGLNVNEREDGMAVLVNKKGRLKLLRSRKVMTGPQRIAQIVHCEEKSKVKDSKKRNVLVANTHLSFPGGQDENYNARKQAFEVIRVARALQQDGTQHLSSNNNNETEYGQMQIIAGDFNSNSRGLAAKRLTDKFRFVNCASATAEQTLCSGSGGRINLGVTHRTHRGEDVSVDHIFTRIVCNRRGTGKDTRSAEINVKNTGKRLSTSSLDNDHLHLRSLGYLPGGAQILNTQRLYLQFNGESIISDHRPVTAVLKWPKRREYGNPDDLGEKNPNILEYTDNWYDLPGIW